MAEIAGYLIPTLSGVDYPRTEASSFDFPMELVPVLTASGEVTTSGVVTYVMRGYDDDVSHLVYWPSYFVDAGATDYGGVGPVTDVVVFKVIGA